MSPLLYPPQHQGNWEFRQSCSWWLQTSTHEPLWGVLGQKPGVCFIWKWIFYWRESYLTRDTFERALASAEGAKYCTAFSCGIAALLLKSGDHVIALDIMYGTSTLFKVIVTLSLQPLFTFMNMDVVSKVEATINLKTKMIWLESPSNPLLNTLDLRIIAALAKSWGLIDSTFLSHYLQRPLELGADIVVHSVTKFIAGHSDVLMVQHSPTQTHFTPSCASIGIYVELALPFDCYLAIRGLKTLPLRMDTCMNNVQRVAEWCNIRWAGELFFSAALIQQTNLIWDFVDFMYDVFFFSINVEK